MPVGLREVADRAGLSRATISRILNDRGAEARIPQETQDRVRRIAEEIGYRPNRLAQGLIKGRSNIIGLMIPGLNNPFFLTLLETAEIQAFQSGYDVLPDSAFQLRASYDVRGKLSGWPVDGILAWIPAHSTVSDYVPSWTHGMPTVYLGYERSDGSDYVAVDREIGVRQLIHHLRSKGYRRIAYVYPWANLQPMDVRYRVYETICAEVGQEPLRIPLEVVDPQNTTRMITQAGLREAGLETGSKLALRRADERPDAILCHNDLVAIGLYHGLMRAGVRVPEDIAVAGFDGIDEGLFLDKPLTTVVSPAAELVDAALRILTYRLNASGVPAEQCGQVLLPSLLRIGATT